MVQERKMILKCKGFHAHVHVIYLSREENQTKENHSKKGGQNVELRMRVRNSIPQ